jgi:PAS domain S-box-containing protein
MLEVQKIIDKNKEALIIPDGIAVIGKDMNIIVFNEAASRISGYPEGDIVGENCSILFRECMEYMDYISESLGNNRVYTNIAINITGKNGSIKNVLSSISPITKDGIVLSVVLVFRDTHEMLYLSGELEARTTELMDQKNKLDAIFNSNIEGTFTIDNEWNITSFNASAEKITGYRRAEALGKKCWTIFNSQLCRNGCHMEKTMRQAKPMIGNELEILHKSGRKIPIRVNSAILLNNKDENIGAVETFIDISEIKNLSAHLDEFFNYENIIGRNKEIKQVIDVLESVSQTDSSVLLTGESGTGKELAARAVHLKVPGN